jgi:hypothetical protein
MSKTYPTTPEHQRLADSEARKADWKNWGPYVSERAWGTVREDYSEHGTSWEYFPHDHARSRAYRWNEDGLAGVSNRFQNLCLGLALWNERDPILKERLFGLTGNQGNHGEDVKEYYYYLDSTPTHSYMRMLYKYPQIAYPYDELIQESARRDRGMDEYELIDALRPVFESGRYFDVDIEYAKAAEDDLLAKVTVFNRGPEAAPIHILPQIWGRNTWSWGHNPARCRFEKQAENIAKIDHRHLGERWWSVDVSDSDGDPEFQDLLFTENDTNYALLFDGPNETPFVKDAFHRHIIHSESGAVNPDQYGSKVGAHFQAVVPAGGSVQVRIRFAPEDHQEPFSDFDALFDARLTEADQFYDTVIKPDAKADDRQIQRQAFAGLMWSKQFYHYGVQLWLDGDPGHPAPPASRQNGRNKDWQHLYNLDILSMPDKWEYPWFAAWDLAFHVLPIALIDPEWAKRQLILMTREWYMHPNGQIPAYEWAFGDVNPPVHAWACWRVYKISRNVTGHADLDFLKRVFHKLLLNFTWWVNRKDVEGNNIFQGGFLGLDNIGVFDRSAPLPTGGFIEQADGTAWMGMYCLNMLAIALELARHDVAYEDVATKFFEHFIYIANAINDVESGVGLWDEEDGFYYDRLHLPNGQSVPLKVRSLVGLIPLFAVETFEADILELLPRFRRRTAWFVRYRPELMRRIASITEAGKGGRFLLSMLDENKLRRVLGRMLDPEEFLSDYGLRGLSRFHQKEPYRFDVDGTWHQVGYEPAESRSGLFGGNSNWRGPIWFPVNYLMIESLQKYDHYFGNQLKLQFPTGAQNEQDLAEIAGDIGERLIDIFRVGADGTRPVLGDDPLMNGDPRWRDHIPFYEYFHGDSGKGLGASHQTGWTALVAKLLMGSDGH